MIYEIAKVGNGVHGIPSTVTRNTGEESVSLLVSSQVHPMTPVLSPLRTRTYCTLEPLVRTQSGQSTGVSLGDAILDQPNRGSKVRFVMKIKTSPPCSEGLSFCLAQRIPTCAAVPPRRP